MIGQLKREVIVQPQRIDKMAFYKYNSISKGTGLGKHELHVIGSKQDLSQGLRKPETQKIE